MWSSVPLPFFPLHSPIIHGCCYMPGSELVSNDFEVTNVNSMDRVLVPMMFQILAVGNQSWMSHPISLSITFSINKTIGLN